MATEWTLYRGDFGDVKEVDVIKTDKTIKDLTGLTAKLVIWKGPPEIPVTVLTVDPITIPIPESAGIVQWTVKSTDGATLPVGTYTASVKLYSGTSYIGSVQVPLRVLPNA